MTPERLAEIEAVAHRARNYCEHAVNVVAVPAVEMLALCAAFRRTADAAGVGRITTADREAARVVGELLTESLNHYNWRSQAEYLIATVRATGSGFGIALAEWLEKWAGEEQG